MGTSDPSTGDVVSLQIIVAAGSIALGFASGAVMAWALRCRNRAKIASARLDCYIPVRPSAVHERAPSDTPKSDDTDEPPAAVRSGRDRRRHPRLDFFGTQWIAPFSGGALPDEAAFHEVRCLDISTGGFSFATTESPDYRSIIVRFQVGGAPMYLTARIVDCRPYDAAADLALRVGCEFMGRFSADQPGPPASQESPATAPALDGMNSPALSLGPALQQN
jgi:hypothetical protein